MNEKNFIPKTDQRKLSEGELEARANALLDAGFSREWIDDFKKLRPALYAAEKIDAKIEGLKQRGFSDPQKMITSDPQILDLGFENIDAKIEGLKQRGFSDPQKMITSSPEILGYGFENIDEKIEYLNRVIRTYKLPLSPISLIENILSILGTKMEKLKVLTRVLRRCDVEKEKISEKIIRKIIFSNLEDVLVAVQELDREKEYISQFLKRVDSIKKRKISKEKKRETIKIIPDEKIKRTYFRGYSEK